MELIFALAPPWAVELARVKAAAGTFRDKRGAVAHNVFTDMLLSPLSPTA